MTVNDVIAATNSAPLFGPVLFAALPAGLLPLQPLQAALDRLMELLRRRHPAVFERLSEIRDPRFLIDAVDLPLVFVLNASPAAPRLVVLRREAAMRSPPATAIRGPLLSLIALLEGRIDGDALFFSRDLTVEGDTEAVVALRNAVDSAEVDILGDVLATLGPLDSLARRGFGLAVGAFVRAETDLRRLQSALLRSTDRRLDALERHQADLSGQIEAIAQPTERRRRTA